MRRQLNQKNYIAIADWMVTDHDLNTRELLTYAIIYGFSQDGESCFSGSLSYLADWLNVSRRDNVLRYLKSLEEKGLISKEKKTNGRNTWCEYRTIQDHGTVNAADHVMILPWMIESGLKDKELILYALIYGFSRKGSDSYFTGSNEYVAKWLGIDKQHVSRYTGQLIKKHLIEKSQENHLIRYRAILPENIMPNQIEYTLTNTEDTQDQPLTKLSTALTNLRTDITKLSTDNLENNLDDNLVSSSNNNNKLSNVVYASKDSLSVVVNERIIDSYDLSSEIDQVALKSKKDTDYAAYQKYCQNRNKIDIALLLQKIAHTEIVYILGYYPDSSLVTKGLDLLCKTVTNKHFKDRSDQINSLNNDQADTLFREAFRIHDPKERGPIYRSDEAYMIGVVDNVLYDSG